MRVLLYAVLCTALVHLLSCKKDKNSNSPEEQINNTASYATNVFKVTKGTIFTSGAIQHDYPAGVKFSIKDVKNDAGKTVSDFLATYKTGSWQQPINKSTDLTESAVIAKYKLIDQAGISIDATTGVVTIAAKATENITTGTYYIDVEAVSANGTQLLSKIASVQLTDGIIPVKSTWKYASESTTSNATVTVTKLSGTALTDVTAKIPNYSTSKTYVRLKIADARNKGVDILKDISWQTSFSLSSINQWVTATVTDDGVLLSSPIDRFPVLEADSVIKGSVQASQLVNKSVLSFESSINIKSEGVYDVTIKMNNHPTQNALWWPSGKTVYIPNDLKSNDFLSNNSRWSYERMDWSQHFVVFWEKGFGADPSVATNKVDIKTMLQNLEHFYAYDYDTMKFVQAGSSKADQYRTMVMLHEQTDWLATGSGYDNTCGAMWINYSAANSYPTLAHELGHTFQYLNGCDGKYAFSGSYNYIGQIWEQTAQYQASLLYPSAYFSYIPDFVKNTHLNLLHETNRYSNFYHLQYWHLLHGVEFAGKLWQQAIAGEDAVEAYIRINGISQAKFNDEIYDYAKRILNWNFLHKSYYTNYILPSSTLYAQDSKVNLLADGYYQVDVTKCVQNYGFNALQLTVPATGTVVQVDFQGLTGVSGYNNTYDSYAGWRWGLVAITSSGDAVYSSMNNAASGSVSFTIPANTSRLYWLVTGAPTLHFHHAWDDNAANDEQYPWKAKFSNTQPKN